jgi:hypothetical protein
MPLDLTSAVDNSSALPSFSGDSFLVFHDEEIAKK